MAGSVRKPASNQVSRRPTTEAAFNQNPNGLRLNDDQSNRLSKISEAGFSSLGRSPDVVIPPTGADNSNRAPRRPVDSMIEKNRLSTMTIDRQPLGAVQPIKAAQPRDAPVGNLPAYRFSSALKDPEELTAPVSLPPSEFGAKQQPPSLARNNQISPKNSYSSNDQSSLSRNIPVMSNDQSSLSRNNQSTPKIPVSSYDQSSLPRNNPSPKISLPGNDRTSLPRNSVMSPKSPLSQTDEDGINYQQQPKGNPSLTPSPAANKEPDLSRCMKCKKDFIPGEPKLQALGGAFHVNHFTCERCSTSLENGTFFEYQGAPYCETCLNETVALPKCGFCNEPIRGKVMNAMGKAWHPEHFFCALCGQVFLPDMPFMEHEGKAYCESDYYSTFAPKVMEYF